MGLWQTGYLEHHELPDLENYRLATLPPERYGCSECGRDFVDLRQLYEHRLALHPIVTPTILIRGRQLDARTFHVSTPLCEKYINIRNIGTCEVNGKAFPVSKLLKRLTSPSNETINLCIENKGISRTHQINYLIADPAEIENIERSYVDIAGRGPLSRDGIDAFIKSTAHYTTAPQYRDGICQYLYGVSAKDGSRDSNIAKGKYTEKLNDAAESLANFDTVVSRAIRSAIAFHYNLYRESQLLTPTILIGRVAGLLRATLETGKADFGSGIADVHPSLSFLFIDRETMEILQIASQGEDAIAMSAEVIHEKYSRSTNGYDRLKLAILAAEALSVRRDSKSQTKVANICREYLHAPDVGGWARIKIIK